MATTNAKTVQVQPGVRGVYHFGNSQGTEETVSKLLQQDLERHHVFFNDEGFHNHIPHQILTLYALDAPTSILEKRFANNASYQRDPMPREQSVLNDMLQNDNLEQYRGKEKYYPDFLLYYQTKIEEEGVQETVNKALFARDKRADDLLLRLYAGFLHPMIQFGFGVEFGLPAVIAEGLAQASVHEAWMHSFFVKSEERAKEIKESTPLVQLLDEARENEKLRTSTRFSDANKVRDGILKRAPDEMIELAARWSVDPAKLDKHLAEMTNASVYFTFAAQRPDKEVKIDFFYMHCVNCSIFLSAFLKQSWISTENKVRLLEWKGRTDLALYVSRGAPELLLDEITSYIPKCNPRGGGDQLESLVHRIWQFDDDGHAPKLLRALAHAEVISKPYEQSSDFRIKGDMWNKVGNMAVDSVEAKGATWVRSTGFDEAWKDFADKTPRVQL